ncbi:flavin reductase [Corynebacterium sp. zg254]|uniref:Flavin reductase n=1 Tax=Corynebacterium zhongnanshanii TaxID=2768834 RepID=A0ABQ6VDP6_9CORY|nr:MULTISPECIES: flavin reductase family protein [Corynebacterium]KAB3520977.1 flavin reductase [Corynebacterium zhongnanshanii]MCR5914611.1 flavin reductase [Corynebacterium sp. zg254]
MSDNLATAFRDVFRGHPAGVALITATVDNQPVGITLSSVASLSLDPLSISFSFMKRTGSAGKLLRADSLLVHFLSDEHADIAQSFARSQDDRFSPPQGWDTAPTGEPLLPGCRAVLRVKIIDTAVAGDSTLCAAEVLNVWHDPHHSALLFMGHQFYSIDGLTPLR